MVWNRHWGQPPLVKGTLYCKRVSLVVLAYILWLFIYIATNLHFSIIASLTEHLIDRDIPVNA